MPHYNPWVDSIVEARTQEEFENALYGFFKNATVTSWCGNVSLKISRPNIGELSDYTHPRNTHIPPRAKRNFRAAVKFYLEGKYKKFPAFARGEIIMDRSPEAQAFLAKKHAYEKKQAEERKAQAVATAKTSPKKALNAKWKKTATSKSILSQIVDESKKQFETLGKEVKKSIKNVFGPFFKK